MYSDSDSYIVETKWKDFIKDPQVFIDVANNHKENIDEYDIHKKVTSN